MTREECLWQRNFVKFQKRPLASSSDYCLILKLRGVKQASTDYGELSRLRQEYIAASFPAKSAAILSRPRIHFLRPNEMN